MDRCAVFVDAGYLIAEGGKAYLAPEAKRGDVAIDYGALVRRLCTDAAAASGLPLLRVYWYDGAVDAVPTAEQQDVSALPDVKLRLGRISGGRQKGVDALVYRDLSVLSRERAVCEAFLLAGDDDLRESVTTAQELGVRVTLWGVGHDNQARGLVAEADRVANADLGAYFSIAPGSALAHTPQSPLAPSLAAVAETGRAHAREWAALAGDPERGELLASRPVIPSTLDAELLRRARAVHGDLRGLPDARAALRAGFWAGVDEAGRDDG